MQRACLLKLTVLFLFLTELFLAPASWACTRALWVNDKATVVGRTMDWQGDMQSNLWVFPRGIERDGLADVNTMKWTSKYGSVVTQAYDAISTDGLNEKGLAVHIFWLLGSDYGVRNPALPGISVLMWEQYFIDNFASVAEAVQFIKTTPFQVEPFELDLPMTLHFLLEDSTGDSAVIEYTNGQPHVYHDRAYTVVTNAPTFDKHLVNLRQYQGFGGKKALPGTTESLDRFVRAAYYVSHLPEPESERDAITKILTVTSNTAMPYGTSSPERPTPSETIWQTAIDLTHHVYYFTPTAGHNLVWASLDKFNLNQGAPILKLDMVHNPDRSGDMTNEFKPETMMQHPRSIAAKFKRHA